MAMLLCETAALRPFFESGKDVALRHFGKAVVSLRSTRAARQMLRFFGVGVRAVFRRLWGGG